MPRKNKTVSYEYTTGYYGYTPLHRAVADKNVAELQKLLAAGYMINVSTDVDKASATPSESPLAMVLRILNAHSNGTRVLTADDQTTYYKMMLLLLDYGADRTPIGEHRRYEQQFQEIRTKLGISEHEMYVNHKIQQNEQRVRDCGKNDEESTIFLNFYNLLQSRFTTEINAVRNASAGYTEIENTNISKMIVSALGGLSIPGAGLVAWFTENYFTHSAIANFKKLSARFINSQHIDEIASDFSARMTEYYKAEILLEDPDITFTEMGQNMVDSGAARVTSAVLRIASRLTGLAPAELAGQDYQKIIDPHWEKIASRCILQFISFLSTHQMSYEEELGKVAVMGSVADFDIYGPFEVENINGFSLLNARNLGAVSQLMYESESKIKEVAPKWGFSACKVRHSNFHKSALFCADDKIIVAFRGTHHHEVQWLRDNANIAHTTLSVRGHELTIHKGFHRAVSYHWASVQSGEKTLREDIEEYLSAHTGAKIYIAGHSLGGAMAANCYLELLKMTINGEAIPIDMLALYTYGQPKWCTPASLAAASSLFANNYFRVMNYLDPVPYLPPDILYKHCGEPRLLHKENQVLAPEAIEQYRTEIGEDGFNKISDNLLALLLNISQHGMPQYVSQLRPRYKIVITEAGPSYVECSTTTTTMPSPSSPETKAAPTPTTPEKPAPITSSLRFYVQPSDLTDVHQAAISGDLDGYLALSVANIDEQDTYGRTALMLTLLHRHDAFASTLIAQGASVEGLLGPAKQNLLCYAAAASLARSVNAIASADPALATTKDKYGHTAIYYAVQNGNVSIVAILAPISELETLYDFGITVLWKAAKIGNNDVVNVLLENRADPEFIDTHGKTSVLRIAIVNEKWLVVQTLITRNVSVALEDLRDLDGEGTSILHICCTQKDMDPLYLFLADTFKQRGWLVPIEAKLRELVLANNKVHIFAHLHDYEYSNAQLKAFAGTEKAKTLVDLHSFVGWKMKLIDAISDIDFNRVNCRNNTVLYELVSKVCLNDKESAQKFKYLEFLIEEYTVNGHPEVYINYTKRPDGWTALHLAVSSHQQNEIIKLLYNAGANIFQKDQHGYTPFDLAIIENYGKLTQNEELITRALKEYEARLAQEGPLHDYSTVIDADSLRYIQKIRLLQYIKRNSETETTFKYCIKRIEELKTELKDQPIQIIGQNAELIGALEKELTALFPGVPIGVFLLDPMQNTSSADNSGAEFSDSKSDDDHEPIILSHFAAAGDPSVQPDDMPVMGGASGGADM